MLTGYHVEGLDLYQTKFYVQLLNVNVLISIHRAQDTIKI